MIIEPLYKSRRIEVIDMAVLLINTVCIDPYALIFYTAFFKHSDKRQSVCRGGSSRIGQGIVNLNRGEISYFYTVLYVFVERVTRLSSL